MDDRTFTVEEVAKKLNITPRTLHYYEEMGLITPASRTVGGHRLYDDPVVEKLHRILKIKDSLGISLQEIREVMDIEDALEQLKESYLGMISQAEKQNILHQYIVLLEGLIGKIDNRIANLNDIRNTFDERLKRTLEMEKGFRSNQ